MLPIRDNNHVAEAQALVTEQFKNGAVITGVLKSLVDSLQEIEGVLWDVISARLIATPPVGVWLDGIGKIVGEGRLGRSDTDYLYAIKLRIKVNRSTGRAEDILQIANLALFGVFFGYREGGYADFEVSTWNIANGNLVALSEMLHSAKSLGTYGLIKYSTWADGGDFEFISRAGGATGEKNWDSRQGGADGGLMVAVEVL